MQYLGLCEAASQAEQHSLHDAGRVEKLGGKVRARLIPALYCCRRMHSSSRKRPVESWKLNHHEQLTGSRSAT